MKSAPAAVPQPGVPPAPAVAALRAATAATGLGAVGPVPEGLQASADRLSAVGDLVLVLDREGVVRCAAGGRPGEVGDWVGRRWSELVDDPEGAELARLLREVQGTGAAGARELRQLSGEGRGRPMAWVAVALERDDRVLAVGRDLAALTAMQERLLETEQTMERDYWRMRQAEARYRLLFRVSREAILLVDAGSHRILDGNLAAGRLFGLAPEKLVGRGLTAGIDAGSRPAVEELLRNAPSSTHASEVQARVAGRGAEVRISATPFRSEGSTLLLVRARVPDEGPVPEATLQLASLAEQLPDAVTVTDADGRIVTANPAFLELVQLVSREQAEGRGLDEWVGRPGGDLSMVLAILKRHGSVRAMPTSVRSAHGEETEIEISAVVLPGSAGQAFGFVLRDVARRGLPEAEGERELAVSVARLTGRIGRASLPELVRDTTDLVERHLIRAALTLTGGNRTTAAEVLGLSRQSLYVKLRRRGLQCEGAGDGTSAEEA